MHVILMEPVGSLGDLGEEVSVKSGFARNYLIPQGKAVRATPENRTVFETRRAELQSAANERLGEAERRALGLDDMAVTIVVKAGEEGKLYGSVGTQDIADAISAKGTSVVKSEIKLPEGVIRALGDYEIDVQLHADVFKTVRVAIVPE